MSAMKRYVYNGPTAGVTLKDGTDVSFVDGGTTKPLPENDPHISRMVRRGHLKEAPQEQQPKKKEASKATPKSSKEEK